VSRPFLTAAWRHLAILNYEVDPALLAPQVPRGTELDLWDGRAYVSVVGFLFQDIRVLGMPVPLHREFEEVNLRFYVRHRAGSEWRRGVSFIRELVPRRIVSVAARLFYNENYATLPMSHELIGDGSVRSASYRWRSDGRDGAVSVAELGPLRELVAGSEAEFITEHHWGYTRQRNGGTIEYHVEHPRWRVAEPARARLDGDAAAVYGEELASAIEGEPSSSFFADGSAVAVGRGVRLEG
jgi:uncharacterized protein YqjF (DUF2071 family)